MLFKLSLFFSFWTLLQQILLPQNEKTAMCSVHVNIGTNEMFPRKQNPNGRIQPEGASSRIFNVSIWQSPITQAGCESRNILHKYNVN